jgi:hypothetical protein
MRQLCTFFFAVTLFIAKTNCSTAQVNVKDSLALVDLYNSTDGAHWINNSGWLNGPVKTWFGVFVSTGRVQQLTLYNNNLKGTLPSSLGKLKNLTSIDLQFNQLSGSIPSSLGNISNLQYIQLDYNNLTGSVPSSFSNLTKLGILGVSNNKLSGKFPSLVNSTQITDLFLENNAFTGPIPDFHTASPFGEIHLDFNQFSGTIPDWLGNMTRADQITLAHNKLTGNIPASLGNLKPGMLLWLSDNQLSGAVPLSITNLQNAWLSLENNHFSYDGLEDVIKSQTPYYIFTYSPQLNIPVKYTPQGAFGKLSVHAGGTLSNNTYQWYKNNALYKTVVDDSTFTPDGEGVYFVKVNNSVVTDLQLVSDNITIVTACSSTPTNTVAKNITSTSVKLTWSASQGAIKYTVQFKPASATTFTIKSTSTTATNLSGLLSNTQYVWKVKAVCSLKSSAFTALNNFTTLPALTGSSSSGAEIQQQTDLSFYPNPATKNVNIFLNASKQTSYSVSIYDLQGRKLITQAGAANAGENNFTLDVHTLSAGTYLVKINYDNKKIVRKLVKE